MAALDGRVALVTGGARGIGEAVARRFVAEGASVVIGDLRDELGEALAADLGGRAHYVHLDVTSEGSWDEAVDSATSRFGKLDGLVNNAGIFRWGPLRECSMDDYRDIVAVNQSGVLLGMRAVIGAMERAGGGTIVNVSSGAGLTASVHAIAYTASKFAVTGMTKVAALELKPLGIRVNSVHPGFVATPLTMGDGSSPGTLPGGRPAVRPGEPREIANLILYLTSDESSYSTGAHFLADDGALAGPAAVSVGAGGAPQETTTGDRE